MAKSKILVVEDDIIIQMHLQRSLQHLGYNVIKTVSNGIEAIEEAGKHRPEMVLMDVKIDGSLDGVETADRIKKNFGIPVIYLTAFTDEDTLKRAKITEPYGYILKPFEIRELKTSIEIGLYRHKLEKKVCENERRLSTILKSIGDGVIVTNDNRRIIFMNPLAATLTGFFEEEAKDLDLPEIFRINKKEIWKNIKSISKSGLNESKFIMLDDDTLLYPKQDDKNREPISISGTISCIHNETGVSDGFVLAFRDITYKRKAEEELLRSREQLRSFAGYLETIREEERKNISREIHDELGQTMTALKMNLISLTRKLPGKDDSILERVEAMTCLIDTSIQSVQRITARLRPGVIDELGLHAAIEWLVDDFRINSDIECDIMINNDDDFDYNKDISIAVFRILQEALTNIARHANANRVEVKFRRENGNIRLTVKDNGKGISEYELTSSISLGLIGMKERAVSLGGKLKIEGIRGKGTRLTLTIPHAE